MKGRRITVNERATILAALRYWQRCGTGAGDIPEHDIATDCGMLQPLTPDQIDALCERINFARDVTTHT